MDLIDIISGTLLCIFGIAYASKLIILSKRNNIKANILGKGKKPKQTLLIEKSLKVITFAGIAIWIVNAFLPMFAYKWFMRLYGRSGISFLGLAITFIGVLFFILAMWFMKTSWRAGIDKYTKTALVTSGVYSFSRNPAFVGMDLMFIGTAITYTNIATLILVLLVIAGLHIQILEEEKHMKETFGNKYNEYVAKTPRYLLF